MQSNHQITFDNAFNDWSEALPLGNGHFGAMAYLDRQDGLVFTFNHYDLYYRPNFTPEALASGEFYNRQTIPYPDREEMKRRATEAHEDPNHPAHSNYNYCFNPNSATSWGMEREGLAMAIAGSMRLIPRAGLLKDGPFSTRLDIESGQVQFCATDTELDAVILRQPDVCLIQLRGLAANGIVGIAVSIPQMRRIASTPSASYFVADNIFLIENKFSYFDYIGTSAKPADQPYVIALKVVGAKAELKPQAGDKELLIELSQPESEVSLLLTVVPPQEGLDLRQEARRILNTASEERAALCRKHAAYWDNFFRKSSVSLPDPLLENLWYLHLYSLACSSGEGSVFHGESCGLNGLWDIKGPTQWGSSWYWDVNIEQAFWPVFASNHLELIKPFHKGLLAWADAARTSAREFHKVEGIAADFPFTYYLSIWAWCAQYFWWYYTHSLDKEFLEETAYPLFKDILKFYEGYAEYDEAGKLVIFPDVAPEQGPLTKNSLSTISCLKYLLRFTIESSKLLEIGEAERAAWESMLGSLGEYAWAHSWQFGEYYKDSEWAESLLFLAHPHILKPIFPIREITKRSSKEEQSRALGTLRYADALQTYVTFGMWQAAAAAVLGLGDEAVRMLYDRGISLMMSANGMFSEETDRWMQNCFVNAHPSHCPPMMEAGGTLVSTINEMLLQSYDGLIEVFPAIPVGAPTQRFHEERVNPPHLAPAPIEPWKECSFENLLAEGAFEVSAWLHEGQTAGIRIRSLRGGLVRLVDSFPPGETLQVCSENEETQFQREGGVVTFNTDAGQAYLVSRRSKSIKDMLQAQKRHEPGQVLAVPAFTRRRVFLGKNRDTDYHRALDGALLDYHAGHVPQSKLTIYKFDFTSAGLSKDYHSVVSWQWHVCGKQGGPFVPLDAGSAYSLPIGRGWARTSGLQYHDHGGPDDLRRDSVSSLYDAELKIDLRAGQYQLIPICGSAGTRTSVSIRATNGTEWQAPSLGKGEFEVGALLLNHYRDSTAVLHFESADGVSPWAICGLIINRVL